MDDTCRSWGYENQDVKIPAQRQKYVVDQGPSMAPMPEYFGWHLGHEPIRPIKLRVELALPPQARLVSAWMIVQRMNRLLGLQVLNFMNPSSLA